MFSKSEPSEDSLHFVKAFAALSYTNIKSYGVQFFLLNSLNELLLSSIFQNIPIVKSERNELQNYKISMKKS